MWSRLAKDVQFKSPKKLNEITLSYVCKNIRLFNLQVFPSQLREKVQARLQSNHEGHHVDLNQISRDHNSTRSSFTTRKKINP